MPPERPILVVDDDDDVREAVALALEGEGYPVESAADGAQAMELLGKGLEPAVVLLDLMMPHMDGEAFLTAVRRDPETATLPVVLLSGHHAAKRKANELGANGCLVKPVELDDLTSTVRRFAA